MTRKKEGFAGEKAIVLPSFIQKELQNNPLTAQLYATDVGFYPEARYHFRERLKGCFQFVLIYCVQGRGWVDYGGTRHKVCKDQFFIIPGEEPHRYGADDSDPWSIYWVHFSGQQAASFVKAGFVVTDINPAENTRNDRRIRLFEEIYQNLSMGYSSENMEYSSICLWYLLGAFTYVPQFERMRSIQQHDIIEKSIMYMHQHLEDSINLNDLADLCGYSVSHYSMIFKKKTSRSPIDYFINLKIQRACQLLDFSTWKISEISVQLGFEDQFYFSRVFRKVMGCSPAEYRKNKKG
jgi:AraC-like DNA-binding protein